MEPAQPKGIKIALIGATGAIGREIVKWAMSKKAGDSISELTVIVRRKLKLWTELAEKSPEGPHAKKLNYIILKNFDDLSPLKEKLQGYNAFICTLGTRTKVGEELFKKVDYIYPLEFAKIAKESGVGYYGLLSSSGSNKNSWFTYMKVKGQAEFDMAKIGL